MEASYYRRVWSGEFDTEGREILQKASPDEN
jgi:hypothetical protein